MFWCGHGCTSFVVQGAEDVFNAKRVAAAEADKMVQEIEKEKAKQLRDLEEKRRVKAEADLQEVRPWSTI